MSYEITVLRALLRLARRRAPATVEDILVRVGGEEADVRRALGALARAELVYRTAEGPRLSLAGFAVAAACAAPVARKAKQPKAPAPTPAPADKAQAGGRVIPLVRRRRAA